jgi:hypothetical protein
MTHATLKDRAGPQLGASRWVLLIHQIPPKPDYFRVKVWRRLQRVGAVAIKDSVYVLPRTDETMEDFQWQLREIVAEGGAASVCEASFVDGLSDAQIEALFRGAREADYREITASARMRVKGLPSGKRRAKTDGQIESELGRLKRRLAEAVAIDFFGAPSRRAAQESIARIEGGKRTRDTRAATATRHAAVQRPRGAMWVTRKGVYVDRIASAWLIRRFIDPRARFKFVTSKGYRPRPGELRFDMFEAEYTHEGEACTFETLTKRFGLTDPALRAIGEIVHDIDYKEPKFGRPETAGVERLLAGIARQHAEDTARLTVGAALFDALYEALAEAPKAAAHRPSARPRSPRKPRRKNRR